MIHALQMRLEEILEILDFMVICGNASILAQCRFAALHGKTQEIFKSARTSIVSQYGKSA